MTEITEIPLSRIAPTGKASVTTHRDSIILITAPEQWAYSAEVKFEIPKIETDCWILKIELAVESGVLGVGWLDNNQSDWVTRASATRGAKELSLVIPDHARDGKLIFDNWTSGDEPAQGVIRSIKAVTARTIIMPDRYAVSIRMAGLGDLVVSLCAAWRFARLTHRTLVADWRHSVYTSASSTNLFPLCFEPQPEIAGVPFIGDDAIQQMYWPHPRHPDKWNDERMLQSTTLRPHVLDSDRDAALALIRSGTDVVAPTVVFDASLSGGVLCWREARTFLEALRPVQHLVDRASAFRDAYLRPGPSIGLHVRCGNGGDIGTHAPYWDTFANAINRCRTAVNIARAQLGHDVTVLLCTDNIQVQRVLVELLPNVICWQKAFRAPGTGELTAPNSRTRPQAFVPVIGELNGWHDAEQERDDSLLEMLLLAECDALIRYPPSSFFSFYPAVMKPSRAPPPRTVSELERPCDPADARSAALLL
jgi:hypothetical protein